MQLSSRMIEQNRIYLINTCATDFENNIFTLHESLECKNKPMKQSIQMDLR